MLDQETLAQLEAGYQSTRKQPQQDKPKTKPSTAKRLITGLLPTVGGALGAVGGSFVAPIAGTAAGGAAGSALGEALRQRITGEKTDLGNIGKEAAFGAVPGVFKGAKAGVQAVKGAKATKEASAAERAAQQITSTQPRPVMGVPITEAPAAATSSPERSLLSKLSTSRTRAASGIKTDPGVGGIERADEAAATFQRLGITGRPEKQLRKANEVMASHGKQVDEILAKNPIQLDGTAVRTQVEKAVSDPLKYAELDLSTPGSQKALSAHLNKFAEAKTAKEVNDYVKILNKVATRAKSKLDRGGTLTDKESAALAAKKAGDEVLSQYPEIAPLKRDMATLFERNADITKASEKTVGIPLLGVKSKGLAQTIAGAQSKVGAGAASADAALTSPTGNNIKRVGGSLLGQLTTRAVGGPLLADDQSANTDQTNQTTSTTPNTNNIVPNTDSLNHTTDDSASNNSFFSDPTQVEQAYLEALNKGDSETASAIMKGFELFGQGSKPEKPLSAEASKVIATANSGLDSLDLLRGMVEQGGVPKGTTIPGRGLFGGAGQAVLGTAEFDAAADNVADAMVRARTGAAATKDELALYRRLLPQAFDSPEVQQQKMRTVDDYFTSIANRTGSAGTDAQAALGI
jgi:hypothetical protein